MIRRRYAIHAHHRMMTAIQELAMCLLKVVMLFLQKMGLISRQCSTDTEMSDTKISAFPVATSVGATDVLLINQGGTTKQATFTVPWTFGGAVIYNGAVTYGGAVVSSGSITVPTLTVTSAATFTGASVLADTIKFPATQVPSSDVNTLDDYEEGTWSPGIAFAGAFVGGTYLSRNGSYTKIGRLVVAPFYLQLNTKGSSVGDATLTGLPFVPAAVSAALGTGGEMTAWFSLNTALIRMTAQGDGLGTTTMRLNGLAAAATTHSYSVSFLSNTHFTDTTSFGGTLIYYI